MSDQAWSVEVLITVDEVSIARAQGPRSSDGKWPLPVLLIGATEQVRKGVGGVIASPAAASSIAAALEVLGTVGDWFGGAK